MLGGNAGFSVKTRENISLRGTRQPGDALMQMFCVPEAAVLLFQEQQATGGVLARRQPRGVQVHQGQQGKGRWRGAHGVGGQQSAQANRLLTQLGADSVLRARGQVAFIEQQVNDGVDAGQARAERFQRRRLRVHLAPAQPLAGAGQALVDVGLGGEQPEGNLTGAEAAQSFQGQHQP